MPKGFVWVQIGLMALGMMIGALLMAALTDENQVEPVEECIFAFLYIAPEERESIPASAVEAACGVPVGDIERIANELREAA